MRTPSNESSLFLAGACCTCLCRGAAPERNLGPTRKALRSTPRSARFIGNAGFSIGIDDVTPAPQLLAAKAKTLDTG